MQEAIAQRQRAAIVDQADQIDELREKCGNFERYIKRLEDRIRGYEMELAGRPVSKVIREVRLAHESDVCWQRYEGLTVAEAAVRFCEDVGLASDVEVRDASRPEAIFRVTVIKQSRFVAVNLRGDADKEG